MNESKPFPFHSEWISEKRNITPAELVNLVPMLSQGIEIEQFIEDLELQPEVLEEIVDEICERVGIEGRDLASSDRIFNIKTDKNRLGAYLPLYNAVSFNLSALNIKADKTFPPVLTREGKRVTASYEDQERYVALRLLHVYIHEQAHVVSVQGGNSSRTPFVKNHAIQVGFTEEEFYSIGSSPQRAKVSEETMVNEGVTELLAEQLMQEYVRRVGSYKGLNLSDVEWYFKATAEKGVRLYQKEVQTAENIIGSLAEVSQVSEDSIREAIIYGYLREGKLLTSELETLFIESGNEVVYKELKSWFSGENKDLVA
jgi:hypothetical protein